MPARTKSALSLAELDDVAPADEVTFGSAPAKSRAPQHRGSEDSQDKDDQGESDEEESESEVGNASKRDHYAQVAPSLRRRKAQLTEENSGTLETGRYKGRPATWAELEQTDGQHDSDEEVSEPDEELDASDSQATGSDADSASDAESSGAESSSAKPTSATRTKSKSVRFTEDAATSSKSHDEADGAFQAPTSIASSLTSQAKLVHSIRDQAQHDAARGNIVRAQLTFWQKTLEYRIRVEKILGGRGLGRVNPSSYRSLLSACDEESSAYAGTDQHHLSVLSSVLAQSADLFDTQIDVLGQDRCADDLQAQIVSIGEKRKRSQADADNLDEDDLRAAHRQQLSACLRMYSETLQPFAGSLFERHSAGSMSESDTNKFDSKAGSGGLKALNQSINKQVDSAMVGEGGERLVDRTRRFRGDASSRIGTAFLAQDASGATGQEESTDGLSTSHRREVPADPETFDDSDFYSSLLRSLIDSSASGNVGSSVAGDGASASLFHPRTNTKSRGIDTRASKGRKLRFEVVEKVANFMPRIENRERWTADMKERLFDILPGRSATAGDDDDGSSSDEEASGNDVVEMGGLQLFA
ncbi:unnamed protein product [Parajaminaea phylloscopi]